MGQWADVMAAMHSPAKTFEQFVAAINRHDVDALAALMNPNHCFVDSLGNQVWGAATMQAGWRGYFAMCPDYRIHIRDVATKDATVLAAGEAGGTIDGVSWHIPVALKAVIGDGLVLEWQVFADNKPIYEILARRKG
ncbi:MAG TPA: nuclear transport factor 2 family protein [Acidobacteriaceae bacterium]|nr:nuclear transport factor 2 family protein [Acidobacteriaceae bacterium]